MLFGFVKFNGRTKIERNIRRDQKMKRFLFNVTYGAVGFILLNIILYALASS